MGDNVWKRPMIDTVMADQEHFKILRQGIGAWNRWRESNPDLAPDLSATDRSYAYLRGANLSRTNLSGVKFFAADLRRADLSGADLGGAALNGAIGLTQEQVDSAEGNENTALPHSIRRPDHWRQKSECPTK